MKLILTISKYVVVAGCIIYICKAYQTVPYDPKHVQTAIVYAFLAGVVEWVKENYDKL